MSVAIPNTLHLLRGEAVQPDVFVRTQVERDYASRPIIDRIYNVVLQIFNSMSHIFKLVVPFMKYYTSRPVSYCRLPQHVDQNYDYGWKENNKGLYVFFTGLNGHPVWADSHREMIEREQPEMEVRIPEVPHGGNCPLEETIEPIKKMCLDYARKFPGNRVCFIATSLGTLRASKVALALKNEGLSLRVSCIAGVFFGSSLMNTLVKLKLARALFHPVIIEDLQVGSRSCIELIENLRAPIDKEDERDFEFYATTNDNHIPNFSSGLPILKQGERYYLVEAENHLSIVHRVRDFQLQSANEWLKRPRN